MSIFERKVELVLAEMTLEELLEYNDITEHQVVEFLLEEGFIKLPEWAPEL
jgi:hypothetical protein